MIRINIKTARQQCRLGLGKLIITTQDKIVSLPSFCFSCDHGEKCTFPIFFCRKLWFLLHWWLRR